MGENSGRTESIAAIWLFPDIESMGHTLMNWLGELYDDDEELVSLEINLPDDFQIMRSTVGWEVYSLETIHPKYIRYFRDE